MSPHRAGHLQDEIDYDRIYAAYLQSLVETLRGFSTGIPGLEFWVPHEDPLISFRHLLDAALEAGRPGLAVRFGPATFPHVDVKGLRELANRYGRAAVLATHYDVLVRVDNLTQPARGGQDGQDGQDGQGSSGTGPTPTAAAARTSLGAAPGPPLDDGARQALAPGDVYAAALARAATCIRHERHPGVAAAAGGTATTVRIGAQADGAQLQVEIDPTSHAITGASFFGPSAAETRALLDVFCDLITGLPLLEAAQHGVARLEAELRDPASPRPVPGIVLPRAAHPRFALPAALITQILAGYRRATGYAEAHAAYHPTPGPRWRTASPAQRRGQIAALLQDDAAAGVTLIAIEHDVRVVLALPETLPSGARQSLLMNIERAIKTTVDPRLEVYAEERKDRNKLRRLAVVSST